MTDDRDWRDLPLTTGGRTLVEASAGTGKTWTIGVLYLRLLLEQTLTPRQIVVATYTNAAAAELKERLRARLQQTFLATRADNPVPPDATASDQCWLYQRWHSQPETREDDRRQVGLALAELDMAPIGTLHSLCSRILADHPFASGATFRTPALVDSSRLMAELSDDLWRVLNSRDALDAAGERVRQAASAAGSLPTRAALLALVTSLLQPGVRVVESDAPAPWQPAWVERLRAVAGDPSVFNKNAILPRLLSTLADWHATAGASEGLSAEALRKLGDNANNRTGVLKAAKTSEAVCAVLDFAVASVSAISAYRRACQLHFYAVLQLWARQQLDQRLAAAGQLGFDDLLTTVHAALQTDRPDANRALADALHAAWPVALIDEFQDTDPVQYGILDAIYRDPQGQPRGRLVLIGDPKQAIYRFRGGDIHTYERAKAGVAECDRLQLSVNHRSSAAYVAALNRFYALAGDTLGAPESATRVAFSPALPSQAALAAAVEATTGEAALVLYRSAPATVADEAAALRSCADLIAAQLDPALNRSIGGRPVQASDLCVLVPKHHQARRMIELLRERQLPCVNKGRASVFQNNETASDLLVILDAIVHCHEAARVRAALATRLWGTGYHALRRLRADASAWQALAATFHHWRHDWETRGVLAVVTGLTRRVAGHALATREGERVLTDLRHLGELLQENSQQLDGMESLLKWFQQQIDGGESEEEAAEARALRIESDASCIQVMTLHTSKGLEFPNVFLPLMWKHTGALKQQSKGVRSLVQADGTRRVVLDAALIEQVEREEQDERFRILYVALTRARTTCHVWLPAQADSEATDNQEDTAAVAGHAASAAPLATVTARLLENAMAGDADASPHLRIEPAWPEPLAARQRPSTVTPSLRRARPLPSPPVGSLPSRHSFTTLTAVGPSRRVPDEASAHDESLTGSDSVESDSSAFDFTQSDSTPPMRTPHPDLDALAGVSGADFGNAVHGIFEHRRIGIPLEAQRELVREQLSEYHVRHPDIDSASLCERLWPRLQAVLDTPLGGTDGPCLGKLTEAEVRAELEFNYVLEGVSLDRLTTACADAGYAGVMPARSATLVGLMNGKIDLVFQHDGRFHVLDYKGNRLGDARSPCLEDYAPAALETKMSAVHYRYQALLYTVALERYLIERLGSQYRRDQHLGECWYLFVRAVGLCLPDGTACGVWRHRFSDHLLDAVQQVLTRTHLRESA